MTTEELLLVLDEEAGLETAFTGLDGLRDLLVQQAKQVFALIRRFPVQVRRRWEQLCVAVGAGHTEQIHRFRPQFERLVRSRIEYARKAQTLASLVGTEAERTELPTILASLERFSERVLSGWKTAEDLEELAVQDYPLSEAQLRVAVTNLPAPQAWYDEATQP